MTLINNLSVSNSIEIVNLNIPWGLWFYRCIFRKRVNVSRFITIKLLTPTLLLNNSKGDQRGLCTDKLLHAEAFEVFTQRSFTHRRFLYTDALHKDAFTRINKGTQALLHTELFTQRNLCTEQLLHKETLTRENCDAEKLPPQAAQRSFYTPKLLRAETLPRAAFRHRNFSAQKHLRTEVFMPSSFYTDPFAHWSLYTEKLLHTEASAHSTLLHTANFYTERLCFPFLITYLSRSPSQVHKFFRAGPPFWLL